MGSESRSAPTLTPWDVIKDLYARELNAGLQADWDGGLVAWIGGPIVSELSALPDENVEASRLPTGLIHLGNPIRAVEVFARDKFDLIAPWIAAEARRIYPDAFNQNFAAKRPTPKPQSMDSDGASENTGTTGMDTTSEMWSFFNEIIKEANVPPPVQRALYALMEGQATVALNKGSWMYRSG